MISDPNRYSTMRDSSVGWIGEIPAHWKVRQLGRVGRLSRGNGGNKGDESRVGIPCIRYGDLYTTHESFILKSRSFVPTAKATAHTPIKFGDVVFAASGETFDEIGKSAVNLMWSEARCGGDIILFRPMCPVESRYLGFLIDCRPVAVQEAKMGRGITVKNIYGDQLKYLSLLFSPLKEQILIVRFLDHADRGHCQLSTRTDSRQL